jgi:hypothetical protein
MRQGEKIERMYQCEGVLVFHCESKRWERCLSEENGRCVT